MANLFDPPQMFLLPLTKGRDLYCEFVYEPLVVDGNGDPILLNGQPQYVKDDWPAGATVRLIIETSPVLTSDDATIAAEIATILIDKTVVDAITKTPLWRLEVTYADGIDDVLANGKVKRCDGLEAK